MSNRKTTPDVLGDVLGDVLVDMPTEPRTEIRTEMRTATPVVPSKPAPSKPAPRSSPARATAPKPITADASVKPAPVAWEYLTVVLGDHRGLRPKALNGRPLDHWKSQPIISDFLTVVGRYGWEMVGIVDRDCGEKEAYFKRPQRE